MFKKLTVIVDRGMANDVMDIARKVGVRGGPFYTGAAPARRWLPACSGWRLNRKRNW